MARNWAAEGRFSAFAKSQPKKMSFQQRKRFLKSPSKIRQDFGQECAALKAAAQLLESFCDKVHRIYRQILGWNA
jgi:hypothetical protein